VDAKITTYFCIAKQPKEVRTFLGKAKQKNIDKTGSDRMRSEQLKVNIIGFIPDSLIELHRGRVRFADEARQLIDDVCKIYIETDDQLKVYELARTLADTINLLSPYIILYRYSDYTQVVKQVDSKWEANNDFVISMPERLDTIKRHDEYRAW